MNRFILKVSHLPKELNYFFLVSNSKLKPQLDANGIWIIPKHEIVEISNLKKVSKNLDLKINDFLK